MRLVDVDDGVELVRDPGVEVVRDALGLGPVDDTDRPFEPAAGASCSVDRMPIAWPESFMNPLPESPGMPGLTVNTLWLQPLPWFWIRTPCFGLSFVTPPRSSEFP